MSLENVMDLLNSWLNGKNNLPDARKDSSQSDFDEREFTYFI